MTEPTWIEVQRTRGFTITLNRYSGKFRAVSEDRKHDLHENDLGVLRERIDKLRQEEARDGLSEHKFEVCVITDNGEEVIKGTVLGYHKRSGQLRVRVGKKALVLPDAEYMFLRKDPSGSEAQACLARIDGLQEQIEAVRQEYRRLCKERGARVATRGFAGGDSNGRAEAQLLKRLQELQKSLSE